MKTARRDLKGLCVWVPPSYPHSFCPHLQYSGPQNADGATYEGATVLDPKVSECGGCEQSVEMWTGSPTRSQ